MSRSRKKVAIWKQPNDKFYKRLSNKIIRRTSLQSGGAFRKVLDSWDICDWKWFGGEDKEKAVRK